MNFYCLIFSIMTTITQLPAQTLEMETKSIHLEDRQANISYLDTGEGETTLLFLHGWCINKRYWENQMAYFQQDYRVIALDLPGFGASTASRTNWTVQDYSKDVVSFIERLQLENVVLIGHSMSGEIVVETAMQNLAAVKMIVGVDNFKFVDVAFTAEQMDQFTQQLTALGTDFKSNIPQYAEYMLLHPTTPEEIRATLKNDLVANDETVAINSIQNYIAHLPNVTQQLEQLNLKLHLINTSHIPTNTEGLKNRCKSGYQLKLVPPCGHYPMVEQVSAFNEALVEVLAEL